MADNCLSLDPLAFRPAPPPSFFPDSLWSITESFSRDNDALARALQISLSDDASASASASDAAGSPPLQPAPKHPATTRNPLPCSPSARISKRKSRVSKKSPTTYITADPANFRQMVQQVTGVQFGEAGQAVPVEAVVRPEAQRGWPGGFRGLVQGPGTGCLLPTLDTSAVLLDRARMAGGPAGPLEVGGSGFDFDAGFSSFPTLESWGAM